jgi:hypothetical protein
VTYRDRWNAWRSACRLHFNYRNYRSPDIASGRVRCGRYRHAAPSGRRQKQ